MTGSSTPLTAITEGPLSPERAKPVQELAADAARADGVAPLSEDVLLHLRHGSDPRARDLVLTADRRIVIGYAHLDAPEEAQDGDMTLPPLTDVAGEESVRRDVFLAPSR